MTKEIPIAKVIIQNSEGKFLAVRKADSYDKRGGQWEIPGGKIEDDEDRFEAAKREVEEEVGLKIKNLQEVVRIEIEDEERVNCWVFFTEEFEGEIELYENELQEYRWVSAEEYKNLDWHADSGYLVPVAAYLDDYLN